MKDITTGQTVSYSDQRVEWIDYSIEDELKAGQWAEYSLEGILKDGTERNVYGTAQSTMIEPEFDEVEIIEIGGEIK